MTRLHYIVLSSACVISLGVILAVISLDDPKTCTHTHSERYFDNSEGISLYTATKNAGFLSIGQYRNRQVCDVWTSND